MACRLSLEERVRIQAGIEVGDDDSTIGRRLGRAQTTVSREIARCGRPRNRYRAEEAHMAAGQRSRRPKVCKLESDLGLQVEVKAAMAKRWSPHAIAASLKAAGGSRVCAETIYAAAYNPGRGLDRGAWEFLPRQRKRRRPQGRCVQAKRNQLGEIRPLSVRPAAALDRSQAGHWEGDLIMGAFNRSAVVTLVERVSRYTLLVDLPEGHTAREVTAALIEAFAAVPAHLRLSLTWDQGREMTDWTVLEATQLITVYFCDPHAPWQRPTNEQNNGCIRRWLPKGTDLYRTRSELDIIQNNLNTMPRRLHDWNTAQDLYTSLTCNHR